MFKKYSMIFIRSAVSLTMIVLTAVIATALMQPRAIHQKGEVVAPIQAVEVVPLELHQAGLDFSVDGEVVPFRSLSLVSEVQGRVVYKSEQCRLGCSVRKDSVLLRIDPTDFQLAVDQLAEAVTQAGTNVQENRVQLENTQKELDIAKRQLAIRQQELQRYENSKLPGVYSGAELDTVRSSLLTAQDTVQKLENQIRLYETQAARLESVHRREKANLAQAELDLRRTEVRSPISGIVMTDDFEVNSYIQKGTSVATLLDTSILEIHCNLYMKQVQWLWRSKDRKTEDFETESLVGAYVFPPTPVTIRYDLEGDLWEWTGTLQALGGGGMDAETRMVPCRVTVDQPRAVRLGTKKESFSISVAPPTLLSGMYVSVVVHANPDIPLYRIPEKALQPGNRIWTATGGMLRQHAIRVATTTPDKHVLFYAESDRLTPSDLVVVSPLSHSAEGMNVRITGSLSQTDVALKFHEN